MEIFQKLHFGLGFPEFLNPKKIHSRKFAGRIGRFLRNSKILQIFQKLHFGLGFPEIPNPKKMQPRKFTLRIVRFLRNSKILQILSQDFTLPKKAKANCEKILQFTSHRITTLALLYCCFHLSSDFLLSLIWYQFGILGISAWYSYQNEIDWNLLLMNDVWYLRVQAYFSGWVFVGLGAISLGIVGSQFVLCDGWWEGVVRGKTF